jgi:integrase
MSSRRSPSSIHDPFVGIAETAVRAWVKRTEIDERQDPNGPLTSEERGEVANRWAKADPWTGITVKEPRRKGKPRLKKDSARALWALARERAQRGDEGAILTLMALAMGLRATEIVNRTVGDIDAGGTELIVDGAKTEAGNRTLMLPKELQPLVAKLAAGKGPADILFGDRDRHWAYREVVKLVADAKVERVTPYGLPGTASSIGQAAGMLGTVIAQSLGHESYETTRRYSTDPSAPANAQIARVIAALN